MQSLYANAHLLNYNWGASIETFERTFFLVNPFDLREQRENFLKPLARLHIVHLRCRRVYRTLTRIIRHLAHRFNHDIESLLQLGREMPRLRQNVKDAVAPEQSFLERLSAPHGVEDGLVEIL